MIFFMKFESKIEIREISSSFYNRLSCNLYLGN